jgi:hypothetical protein
MCQGARAGLVEEQRAVVETKKKEIEEHPGVAEFK